MNSNIDCGNLIIYMKCNFLIFIYIFFRPYFLTDIFGSDCLYRECLICMDHVCPTIDNCDFILDTVIGLSFILLSFRFLLFCERYKVRLESLGSPVFHQNGHFGRCHIVTSIIPLYSCYLKPVFTTGKRDIYNVMDKGILF